MTDTQLAVLLDSYREMLLLAIKRARDTSPDVRADILIMEAENVCRRMAMASEVLSSDSTHFTSRPL